MYFWLVSNNLTFFWGGIQRPGFSWYPHQRLPSPTTNDAVTGSLSRVRIIYIQILLKCPAILVCGYSLFFCEGKGRIYSIHATRYLLVVSTRLKHISQIGSFPFCRGENKQPLNCDQAKLSSPFSGPHIYGRCGWEVYIYQQNPLLCRLWLASPCSSLAGSCHRSQAWKVNGFYQEEANIVISVYLKIRDPQKPLVSSFKQPFLIFLLFFFRGIGGFCRFETHAKKQRNTKHDSRTFV